MPKRTSLQDTKRVETADDLDDMVQNKREGWRVVAAKAHRRQCRYIKRMTDELAHLAYDGEYELND